MSSNGRISAKLKGLGLKIKLPEQAHKEAREEYLKQERMKTKTTDVKIPEFYANAIYQYRKLSLDKYNIQLIKCEIRKPSLGNIIEEICDYELENNIADDIMRKQDNDTTGIIR